MRTVAPMHLPRQLLVLGAEPSSAEGAVQMVVLGVIALLLVPLFVGAILFGAAVRALQEPHS